MGPDGLHSSPSRGVEGLSRSSSRGDMVPELTTPSRPPRGPTIRERPSQEEVPMPSQEQRSPTHPASPGTEHSPRAGEVEMLPQSKSSAGTETFYHS